MSDEIIFGQPFKTPEIKFPVLPKSKPQLLYRYGMTIATKWSAKGYPFNSVFKTAISILIKAYEKDNLEQGNWSEVALVGEQLMNHWPPEVENDNEKTDAQDVQTITPVTIDFQSKISKYE